MPREYTCLKHPGRPAIARCKQCNAPICPECSQQYPAGTFCSKLHAERYLAFTAREHELRPSRWGMWLWFFILVATIATIAAFAAHYAGYITLPIGTSVNNVPDEFLLAD